MSLLRRRRIKLPVKREFFTAALSGSEGGLATTTAIIAGLYIGTDQPEVVLITAVISFMVQAFNSAVGRLSAEHTDEELDARRRIFGYVEPSRKALVQFLAHTIMSALVILPLVLIPQETKALVYSIGTALILLFIAGAYKGKIAKTSPIRDGLELVVLGSLVISVGIISGIALKA